MSASVEEDIWGGLDDDDFWSVKMSYEEIVIISDDDDDNNNNNNNPSHNGSSKDHPPVASTNKDHQPVTSTNNDHHPVQIPVASTTNGHHPVASTNGHHPVTSTNNGHHPVTSTNKDHHPTSSTSNRRSSKNHPSTSSTSKDNLLTPSTSKDNPVPSTSKDNPVPSTSKENPPMPSTSKENPPMPSTSKENPPMPSTSKDHLLTPSTSKGFTPMLGTFITSVASLGTRLGDIVESASKRQKSLEGSSAVIVKANKKRKVFRRKNKNRGAPLNRFKYGRLFVTDITTQFWCELQMEYKYEPPPALVDVEIIPKAEVLIGKSLHLVRELQIEKPVKVKVTSAEDTFALKVLSLLDGVLSLVKYGVTKRREIHIFGAPFGMGVYVNGIIDEIRCRHDTLDVEIVEFKTRMTDSMPPDAQKLTHDIQVMLYKRLFDEMVDGTFNKEMVASNFVWLDLDKPLGEELLALSSHKDENTLSKLLDMLMATMRGVPFISSLFVEYALQVDGSTIGYSTVVYDEAWLKEKLSHSLSYWKGQREARGVAIEESWKCFRCDYRDDCSWRRALINGHSPSYVKEIRPPEGRPPSQEEKNDPWISSSLETVSSSENDVVVEGVAVKEQIVTTVELDDSLVLFPAEGDDEMVIEH